MISKIRDCFIKNCKKKEVKMLRFKFLKILLLEYCNWRKNFRLLNPLAFHCNLLTVSFI